MGTLATPLALFVLAAGAQAQITIANHGFEELYFGSNLPAEYGGDVPAGAFPVGPPPAGWTAYYEFGAPIGGASIGVLNPGTAADHAPNPAFFPGGAAEGDNAVLLYMNGATGDDEFGVEQTLGATLQANTTYNLTVEVGNIASGAGLVSPYTGFFNLDGFPGYRIQLLAGGQVVAEDTNTVAPGEGLWATATLQFTTGDNPIGIDQSLGVRVVNRNEPDDPMATGIEVDFDDVRLTATSVAAVPVLPLLSLPAALLLVGLALGERRRRRAVAA